MQRTFEMLFSKISLALALVLAPFVFCGAARAQSRLPAPPPEQPVANYNPAIAFHDVEVGKFYLDKGDLDGAISRFKDAMRYKPNFAEPRLLLGQVYEKKNDPASAIDYYQQYLKILPGGRESKKVRDRIAKLQVQIAKDKAAAANHSGKSL